MPEKDDLDLLLDSALRTYADPASGLDQRVLARIGEARNAARPVNAVATPLRRWLPWTIALPIAAGLLLIAMLAPRAKNPTTGSVDSGQSSERASSTAAPVESHVTPRPEAVHGNWNRKPTVHAPSPSVILAAKPVPLPKLDVFPTPQPLTPEEQALINLAGRTPAKELQALIDAQNQLDKPLSIATIRIPPLELPDQGKN